MSDGPMIESSTDGARVRFPDGDSYRVVSWRPPHLVLERESDRVLRHLFLARGVRDFHVGIEGATLSVPRKAAGRSAQGEADGASDGDYRSPMPGKVLQVLVAEGDTVEAGDRLVIVEAMKMESPVRAREAGTVRDLRVSEGDAVSAGDLLVTIE